MFDVADEVKGSESVELWIANGFWYCDTWVSAWTSHPNFPRPEESEYENAIELLRDLAYFLFMSESPYTNDTLRERAKA